MPKPNPREERDQDKPRRRAVIYRCEPGPIDPDKPKNELTTNQQSALCRCIAAAEHFEIVDEFVDVRLSWPSRPGLHQALDLIDQERLDILIVSSLDRLACDVNEAFDISWRLCLAGAVALPADMEYEFPWTSATQFKRA
jgi:hypothetical protein